MLDGMQEIARVAIAGAKWVSDPHNWVRVLEVVGGGVLLIVGISMLGSTGAGPVADTIGTVQRAPAKIVGTVGKVAL